MDIHAILSTIGAFADCVAALGTLWAFIVKAREMSKAFSASKLLYPVVLALVGIALGANAVNFAIDRWFPAQTPPKIRTEFANFIVPELGSKSTDVQSAGAASEAIHEHAIGIWAEGIKALYAIPRTGIRPIIAYPQVSPPEDPNLFIDSKMRPVTGTPSNKCPPLGGWADAWRQNRHKWVWMGYRLRFYTYPAGQIFYQSFQHGIIIGPFRSATYETNPTLLAIMNDQTFKSKTALGLLPPTEIPHQVYSSANKTCR